MHTSIILGLIQGLAEWLPVSSEGMVVLVSSFFGLGDLHDLIAFALWLHMGTFGAALVYFWEDVLRLLRGLFNWKVAKAQTQVVLVFLVVSTLVSGIIGYVLLEVLTGVMDAISAQSFAILLLIGGMLLVTGYLQLKKRTEGVRSESHVTIIDALVVGVVQGFAIVPGLSRSGLTVATLLMRKFDDEASLRLSFLMSLPLVLGANVVLQWGSFAVSFEMLIGMIAAFIVGLITIHVMMSVAKKVNFGWFVLGFGVLTIAAAFIM